MRLTLEAVDKTIREMDNAYDANFADWICNEENANIVGTYLKKYITKYRVSEMVVVLKWIVKKWTLRSIIVLTRKLLFEGISLNNRKDLLQRADIIQGLFYTWKAVYIGELLVCTTSPILLRDKVVLFAAMFDSFSKERKDEVLSFIQKDIEPEVVKAILNTGVYVSRIDKTRSMIDAFNIG